jgi:hypothetical protein
LQSEQDSFNGISGESTTPFSIIKIQEQFLLHLSVTYTWFWYNWILSFWICKSEPNFGKYKIPVKLNG